MKMVITIIVSAFLLFGFAKSQSKTQGQLMREYVEEKLEVSRKKEQIKCRENTIKDAIVHVDSIIAVQSKFVISDSINSPMKPVKPNRPIDTLKLDSTPITPIVVKSMDVNKDTIK